MAIYSVILSKSIIDCSLYLKVFTFGILYLSITLPTAEEIVERLSIFDEKELEK